MAQAIRTHRHLESDTLHLPELQPFIGKDVEIIVIAEQSERPSDAPSLKGSVLRFEDPLDPIGEDDWEILQ